MAKRSRFSGDDVLATVQDLGARLGLVEKQRRHTGADALAFTTGLVFGALVGAAVAIFLAPTDGQTLRTRLAKQLNGLFGGGSAADEVFVGPAILGDDIKTPVAASPTVVATVRPTVAPAVVPAVASTTTPAP